MVQVALETFVIDFHWLILLYEMVGIWSIGFYDVLNSARLRAPYESDIQEQL